MHPIQTLTLCHTAKSLKIYIKNTAKLKKRNVVKKKEYDGKGMYMSITKNRV